MKRSIFLAMVILLVAAFAIAKPPVTPISQDDLKDLKGEWTGERLALDGSTQKTDLQINNDSLPLKGEVVWYFPQAASNPWRFKNGHIKDGSLNVVWSDERSMKLSLRKGDGKMELEGDIQGGGVSITIFFKKVK